MWITLLFVKSNVIGLAGYNSPFKSTWISLIPALSYFALLTAYPGLSVVVNSLKPMIKYLGWLPVVLTIHSSSVSNLWLYVYRFRNVTGRPLPYWLYYLS
jgi:hypothetical protein